MSDFLENILFGEIVTGRKPTTPKEVPIVDPIGELFAQAEVEQHSDVQPVTKAASQWDAPVGGDGGDGRALTKSAPCRTRQELACGIERNKGARVERTGNWVREFSEDGSLLCGYLAEDA